MITVTDKAKERIVELRKEEGRTDAENIRVSVKGGGCSGLQYEMRFDTEHQEGDQVFEDKGIKVVVEMKSLLYLYGTELDYKGGLDSKGLFFNNPNASRTCACGESFSL